MGLQRIRHNWAASPYGSCVHVSACLLVSNSLWPHGLWPARLLWPWDSPGKHTGVGCHFPSSGNLPNPGIKPTSLSSPALQVDSLSLSHLESPLRFSISISRWDFQVLSSTESQSTPQGSFYITFQQGLISTRESHPGVSEIAQLTHWGCSQFKKMMGCSADKVLGEFVYTVTPELTERQRRNNRKEFCN